MKSQTVVPYGIKFYGSLQNYLDKKFTDLIFWTPSFVVLCCQTAFSVWHCAQCCDDIISI